MANPFDTYLVDIPEFSKNDLDVEIKNLFQRQQAIDKLLRGEVSIDDALDIVEASGIDPQEWIDCSVENVDLLLIQ